MSFDEIKKGIEAVKATQGRSNIIETEKYTVVDDCYNASPKSMRASLDLLSLADGMKIAILGDMFELGDGEEEMHCEVGKYVSDKNTDMLICIGKLAANIYDSTSFSGKKIFFEQLDDAMCELKSVISEACKENEKPTIIVKASHGMHFEKIVEMLTREE